MAKSTLFHLRQDRHLDARRSILDADLGRLAETTEERLTREPDELQY
jgi:hypothetical protein